MMNPPSIEILDKHRALERDSESPLHVQVRRAFRRAIGDSFVDGQQFWTEQALTQYFDVSLITIRRALGDLSTDGLLKRLPAKGTFVCKPVASASVGRRIGLFVARHDSEILRQVVEQVARVCHDRGQRLDMHYTFRGQDLRTMVEGLEHGPESERMMLLGLPRATTLELLDLFEDKGYRAVSVDTTLVKDRADYVGFDDRAGVDIAVKHLRSLGHSRITLLVSEPEDADAVKTRIDEFVSIGEAERLPFDVLTCGTQFWDSAHDAAYRTMPVLWNARHRPTAILAASDAGAWAALKWCAANGVSVPHEVSIMGFDDDRLSHFTHPALTTLGRDVEELASKAVEILDDTGSEHRAIFLKPHLVERASTAQPITVRMDAASMAAARP